MQNSKIYVVIALIALTGTLAANRGLRRIEIVQPHLLSIESLPHRFGDWKQKGEDRPTDPSVQAILKTARLLDRTYQNSSGESVDLLLMTATDYADFHDPTVCLPGHGWTLGEKKSLSVGSQAMTQMPLVQGDRKMIILYGLIGSSVMGVQNGLPMQKFLSLRKAVTGEGGQSLYVRLIASDTPSGREGAGDLMKEAEPEFMRLVKSEAPDLPKTEPR